MKWSYEHTPQAEDCAYAVSDYDGELRARFALGADARRYVADRNREAAEREDRSMGGEKRRLAAYRALTDQEVNAPGPLLADFADSVLVGVDEIDLAEPNAEDQLHEIADGAVPIYTADIIRCFTEDIGVACREPELEPVRPTVEGMASTVLYELAYAIASARLQERRAEREDEDA
jgi:hypothetical protein